MKGHEGWETRKQPHSRRCHSQVVRGGAERAACQESGTLGRGQGTQGSGLGTGGMGVTHPYMEDGKEPQ